MSQEWKEAVHLIVPGTFGEPGPGSQVDVPEQAGVGKAPASKSSQERGCWLHAQGREEEGSDHSRLSFPRNPLFQSKSAPWPGWASNRVA